MYTALTKPMTRIAAALTVALPLGFCGHALAADVDVAAAEALAKKSNCTKCHAADKKKDGPSYKETASKLKGKADAVAKLTTHITTGPKVKIDGVEEEHAIVKSKDAAEISNLVHYILSR